MTVARVDLLHGERTVARVDAEVTLDAWYEWASSLPAPRTLPSEGNLRAQAQQDVDQNGVVGLIYEVFGDAGPSAVGVARCESRFHADAVNGRYRGVFQVGDMHADQWLEVMGVSYWDSWMDAATNVRFAFWLYEQSGGWGPWSCRWAA